MRKVIFIGVAATLFAGTMPVAGAQSLGQCWNTYNNAVTACQGNSQCENFASIQLGQCLDRLERVDE